MRGRKKATKKSKQSQQRKSREGGPGPLPFAGPRQVAGVIDVVCASGASCPAPPPLASQCTGREATGRCWVSMWGSSKPTHSAAGRRPTLGVPCFSSRNLRGSSPPWHGSRVSACVQQRSDPHRDRHHGHAHQRDRRDDPGRGLLRVHAASAQILPVLRHRHVLWDRLARDVCCHQNRVAQCPPTRPRTKVVVSVWGGPFVRSVFPGVRHYPDARGLDVLPSA